MKYETALSTVRVDTNLGEGFLKALGNKEGPHALACELIGSLAANWIGLKTFDFAIVPITTPEEVIIAGERLAGVGPAFITRAVDTGYTWGGDSQTITSLSNLDDVSKLVVLDTWIRNCDRYTHTPARGTRRNLNNVFLVQHVDPRRLELIAMDFTHSFTCGFPIDKRLAYIDQIQDQTVYGLFPEFRPLLRETVVADVSQRLAMLTSQDVDQMTSLIPDEWMVDAAAKRCLRKFLIERAHFVSKTIQDILWPVNGRFDYGEGTI